MDNRIQITDLNDPNQLTKLVNHLATMSDELDILYTTTAPNGNISARQGRIALYNNGGDYSSWINTDGSTSWSQIVSSDDVLWEVDGNESQLKTVKDIDMQSKNIINLLDPTDDQDAATKKYVDDNEFASPLTTKGDLFTYSTLNARLPVGSNNYLLTPDSSETTGLKWAWEVLDEDDMNSDSSTKLATQQSIKAYVDSQAGTSFEIFTADGTFTAPTGVTTVFLTMVGGGGGGGSSADVNEAGGGGGGGACIVKYPYFVTPESSYAVVVGEGGAGGVGDNQDGSDGEDTVFDSTVTVNGGNKGIKGGTGTGGTGATAMSVGSIDATGATAGVAQLLHSVAGGDGGTHSAGTAGAGGGSYFGTGGDGGNPGSNGIGYGSGGGGGGGGKFISGGDGADGVVIIEWFS